MKKRNPMTKQIASEEGFVLVTALIFMVILTVIGISATRTTQFELNIAGNDRVAKVNFYNAESAAMETAQQLMNKSGTPQELLVARLDPPGNGSNQLIQMKDDEEPEKSLANLDKNDDGRIDDSDLALLQSSQVGGSNRSVRKVAIQQGIDRGDSQNLRNPTMQITYWVYGVSEDNGPSSMVRMGVKRRVQTE